eukprot:238806-Prymnesium_polylepis.1
MCLGRRCGRGRRDGVSAPGRRVRRRGAAVAGGQRGRSQHGTGGAGRGDAGGEAAGARGVGATPPPRTRATAPLAARARDCAACCPRAAREDM